jgi:phage tail protein X
MTYITHITTDGERWDLLAWRYYGDPLDYERIIAANPDVPIIPVLPSGVMLNIPVIDTPAAELSTSEELPPWL